MKPWSVRGTHWTGTSRCKWYKTSPPTMWTVGGRTRSINWLQGYKRAAFSRLFHSRNRNSNFGETTTPRLKGHGNKADFLGFLQKLVPHRSLTLPFEPFRFWLRICGDIRNRKTTRQLGESAFECLKENSASRRVGDSPTRQVGESLTPRLGESSTPRLGELGSRYGITIRIF
jgi:hypothetical protein